MEFSFSPDTLMLRDMLRRFVEKEAQPLEMKYFSAGALEPKEGAHLRKVIEQMGLWGILVPEAFGGGGLDTITACLLEEELGKTFIPLDLGEVPLLLYACQGEQVERFLEPALAGSRKAFLAVREPDALRPEDWGTSVVQQGDAYMLNGSKLLSAKPGPEDFLIVFAKTEQEVTAFVLDADHPGLSLGGKDKDGENHRVGKDQRVGENHRMILQIKGCQIGRDSLLGEYGQAFKLGAEEAPRAWIRIGARFVGLADRLVAMAADYAREWVALGSPLMERPAIKRMLAEIHVQVNCARWLVYHAAWLADQGAPLHIPAAEVRLATGEMLQKVTDFVIMVYGGPGPSAPFDLQHVFSSTIPMEALVLGLDGARNMIAADMLVASKER